jgi:type IV fimbrial biogenesis protein FimT
LVETFWQNISTLGNNLMKKYFGFTLIELFIVLMVIGLLFTVGIPFYQDMIQRNRANLTVMHLYHSMQFARSEAMKRHGNVGLCPTEDRTQCTNKKDWNASGYLIFTRSPHDKGPLKERQILKVEMPIAFAGSLTWSCFPKQHNDIQFNALGFTNTQNGTFRYCPKNGNIRFARALFITQSGRVRFSQDQDNDGVHEGSDGLPLRCLDGHNR